MQIASADAPSPMTYTVGTVPPSMTYSVPVMDPARGNARNATRSATPCGFRWASDRDAAERVRQHLSGGA